jgi:hypothetical protein
MDYRKIAFAIVGLLLAFWWQGRLFVSMPRLTRPAGDVIQVGDDAGDHARYDIGPGAELGGAVVGYQFNSFGVGGSFLSKLGARGILSFMNADTYAAAVAAQCRTGQCLASYLNDHEAHGRIAHLILIPQDEAALSQMKKVRLHAGSRVQLSGRRLTFQSGSVEGHPFNGNLGNTGYFLVAGIGAE